MASPDAGDSTEADVDAAAADEGPGEEPTGEEPEGTPPPESAVQIAPGCTAKATIGGFTTWLFFVRPTSPCSGVPLKAEDYNALAELRRLINSVPAGGRIDGHITSITVDFVAEALLAAQTRGVNVWISADGKVGDSTDTAKTANLDKLTHIVYCTSAANSACVSSASGATSNPKLFLFSTATAPDQVVADKVVWLGSANLTLATGTKTFNNTITIYGDVPLYDQVSSYLDDLHARRRTADYYDVATKRGYILATAADVYASPETTVDLVVNRLDDVTPTNTCEVRVMQATIGKGRIDVVNQLVTMKRGGCKVSVVTAKIDAEPLAAFKAANIPVRTAGINDKVFVVYGQYGAGYQYRVYTGSHNLTAASNNTNDEILVKLGPETGTTHPVYDEYLRHFEDAYSIGTPQ